MRILIIQLRRIGDILLTTPVVSYLKQALPGATVDFLCEPMGRTILETHPHIDRLHVYDRAHPLREILRIRGERYDAVLDFMNNPRTSHLTAFSGARWRVGFRAGPRRVFYNIAVPVPKAPEYVPVRKLRLARYWLEKAELASPAPASLRPELFLAADDERFAAEWADGATGGRPFVVVAPAHRHPIRAWRADGFRAVALHLARSRGMKVFLAWGPGEEGVMNQVRSGVEDELPLLPLTSLRQMAAIFKRSSLVVTNDSGAMHLAVAVGAPTVTAYGPTRPVDWNPSLAGAGPRDMPLTAEGVDCLGCHLIKCPIGHVCMKRLPEERVIAACENILKEK